MFESLLLRKAPADGPQPDPAEPVRLNEAQSNAEAPGFDKILGETYHRETNNLRAQQERFKTSRKPGQTLLNYQEVRIRLLHQMLDRYLKGETPNEFAPYETSRA